MYENQGIEPNRDDNSTNHPKIQYLANPVHQIIEQHALNTPQATALSHGDYSMTYSELNQAANNLAAFLNEQHIGADDRIAVCLEPSFDILISLLGILKVGAVYVPLDPTYPQGRIDAILDEIKPLYIISEQYLCERLNLGSYPIVHLNNLSPTDTIISVTPQNNQTAYIFFTSGSTGRPKGVMATYANLAQYVKVAIEQYHMNFTTIMPTMARFSFSISLFELLCPLAAGGSIIIVNRPDILDLDKMAQLISRVTMFHAGPSFLKNILPYIKKQKDKYSFLGVQHASSGGDMIPPDMLESLKTTFPNAEVFVIYGSTEIACMGCTYPVSREMTTTKTYVGKPFPKTKVCIIDEQFNKVPQGSEGEVCFSGEGVSKGYLGKPELTQEKFITINDQVFYRMGDLGKINELGDLQLLGRLDFQVKIRGMRVELGEVEYLLRQEPGIKDCVVSSKDLGNGEQTLIAYVVFEEQSSRDIRAINSNLAYHLPDYMVPTGYVAIKELPLNINMKLDRKALPDPQGLMLRRGEGEFFRKPQQPTQIIIAQFLEQLLMVESVGLDDNFFDLGGHSILAIELMLKIKEHFKVSVESLDILRETVETIARIIDEHLGEHVEVQTNAFDTSVLQQVDTFYFGDEFHLFGILYKPKNQIKKVVLICSPMPYEDDRLDFILSRLARRLTADDVALMQFHYHGTKDSAGDGDISSMNHWKEDISMAHNEIIGRCGHVPIIGLGIRLGAALLWDVQNFIAFSGMVLWDPVLNGKDYFTALKKQHQRIVKHSMPNRNGRRVMKNSTNLELLGTTYSKQAISELSSLQMNPALLCTPKITVLSTTDIVEQNAFFNSLNIHAEQGNIVTKKLSPDLVWLKSSDIIPDTGLSQLFARLLEAL